jgi:hypothetical protein
MLPDLILFVGKNSYHFSVKLHRITPLPDLFSGFPFCAASYTIGTTTNLRCSGIPLCVSKYLGLSNLVKNTLQQKEHRRLAVFRLGALTGSLLTRSLIYLS